GSFVFHLVVGRHPDLYVPSAYVLIPALIMATIIDYLVNVSMVVIHIQLSERTSTAAALLMLRVGALREFLLNYLGLSLIGVVIVELSQKVGLIAVVAFIA